MDMKGRHHQCSSPGLQWSFLGGRQPHSTGPRPFLTPDCLTKLIVMCYVILALFVAVVDTKGHCHHPLTTREKCCRRPRSRCPWRYWALPQWLVLDRMGPCQRGHWIIHISVQARCLTRWCSAIVLVVLSNLSLSLPTTTLLEGQDNKDTDQRVSLGEVSLYTLVMLVTSATTVHSNNNVEASLVNGDANQTPMPPYLGRI